MNREDGDRIGEIDLDAAGPDESAAAPPGPPSGRWRTRLVALRGRSPVLRPWPRVWVAICTAIVTAIALAVVTDRTGPDSSRVNSVPAVVPEAWLLEGEQRGVDPWRYPADSAASRRAAQTVPPQIDGRDFQVAALRVYPVAEAGELVALAPGAYDVYLVCHAEIARGFQSLSIVVTIGGTEGLGETDVDCDRRATPLATEPVAVAEYTALAITARPGQSEPWDAITASADVDVDVGVAVFVVQH